MSGTTSFKDDRTHGDASGQAHAEGVVLYGAVSRLPAPSPALQRIKARMRSVFSAYGDQRNFRRGSTNAIDYRNYELPTAVNIGDRAIVESVAGFMSDARSDLRFRHLNWGELDRIDLGGEPSPGPLMVFAGSGYFHFGGNGRLADRIALDTREIQRIGGKVALFGVGVNRQHDGRDSFDLHPEDARVISHFLEGVDLLSVRDHFSQTVLSPLTSKPVHLIGDPALHFCELKGLKTGRAGETATRAPPVVGINLSFHGPASTGLLKANLNAYCRALRTIQNETGCRFRYFVHYATEFLIPKLMAIRGIEMDVVHGSPETLARAYGTLDLHIGGMLHSCILAHSAGTPCIALAYDIKHWGFFNLFGLEENCLLAATFEPNELLSRVWAILGDPMPVRNTIATRRSEMALASREFSLACVRLLPAP